MQDYIKLLSAFISAFLPALSKFCINRLNISNIYRRSKREREREREREIRLLAVAEDNTIIYNNEMPLLMGWMVNDTLYHPKTH